MNMDGNGLNARKRMRTLALSVLLILATTLLFPSSSALDIDTLDGEREYEQGEVILFNITGTNNATIVVDFAHNYKNRLDVENATWYRDPYQLGTFQLDENGTLRIPLMLDPKTDFGNNKAIYGDWDIQICEKNESSLYNCTSMKYEVEINQQIFIQNIIDGYAMILEETEETTAAIRFENSLLFWVVVVESFLFAMAIATFHLGENPVFTFARWFGSKTIRIVSTVEQGEHVAISRTDNATKEEADWQEKETKQADHRNYAHKRDKLLKKAKRAEETGKNRASRFRSLAEQYDMMATSAKVQADNIEVPTERDLRKLLKDGER